MARPSTLSPRNVQSSPLRPSPDRRQISDYLSDDRNSEASHNEALEYARLEHTRVRLNAIRISEIHQLQEEQRRISEQQKKEQERLLAETALREEQERLRKLQAKKVEPLPPQPDPPKPQEKQPTPPPKVAAQPAVNGTAATTPAAAQAPAKAQPVAAQQPQTQAPAPANPFIKAEPAKASPSPFAQAAAKPPAPTPQTNGAAPAAAVVPAPQPVTRPAPAAPVTPPAAQDPYLKIHQELKKVRKVLGEQSKMAGSPLKGKLGDLRRNIRKSVSQLSGVKGANNQAINTIVAALQESLNPRTPSDPINVSLFVKDNRQPVEGAAHNAEQLPSAFIYLLNHFAKAIILQFTTEASVNPKAVEPVGIVTAHVFSNPAFHWRGKTLIDILIAKFRISCPVLFGVYGSEDTERGRAALGWRKEDGGWVTVRTHMDRMTGLGAGFASISLRDFSKASKTNPYPPSNYWRAVAAIINTPAGRTTNTHYKVLSSMLDSHEARFIQFYGNAAIAALRMAIIEFPKKAPPNSQEAQSLQVLGQLLQKNSGLVLA